MKTAVALMALSTLAIPYRAPGQTTEPDQTPAQAPEPSPVLQLAPLERPASWKLLVPNLIHDQERIWSSPARLPHGKRWIPAAAILATTAALLALDPAEATYFRRTPAFHGFNNIFTGNATAIGTLAAPVSLYAIGLVRRDAKMQRTALLAGEAVGDAEVLTTVLKDTTRRIRPAGVPSGGSYSDTWFESGGSFIRGSGSFPSGHTIAAFSVATVIARRYGNHRWVPYAAYGMATLVGFSRLSLLSHFSSDVFMGGALGYSISRFIVLRQ
ncbi:MAG: phosphatase PAP2 family protein [Bryobacteraceae bacterium]